MPLRVELWGTASRSFACSRVNQFPSRVPFCRRGTSVRFAASSTSSHVLPLEPTYMKAFEEFEARTKAVPDPTTLIMVDEADRLRMPSLKQLRSIFDGSGMGMVLIGMPGIEKRLARYPQFYSRIGFVHEYRPLGTPEIEALLAARWAPPGVSLPPEALTEDIISRIAAMTQGNFRLLNRLLTQLQRVLDLNDTGKVSVAILEAARESLVIGQA